MSHLQAELEALIERNRRLVEAAEQLLEVLSAGGGSSAPPPAADPPSAPGTASRAPAAEFVCGCGREFSRQQGLTRHRNHCDGAPASPPVPTSTSSSSSPASKTGGRLECDDCDFAHDDAPAMIRHTLAAHGRRPSINERTPKLAS